MAGMTGFISQGMLNSLRDMMNLAAFIREM